MPSEALLGNIVDRTSPTEMNEFNIEDIVDCDVVTAEMVDAVGCNIVIPNLVDTIECDTVTAV